MTPPPSPPARPLALAAPPPDRTPAAPATAPGTPRPLNRAKVIAAITPVRVACVRRNRNGRRRSRRAEKVARPSAPGGGGADVGRPINISANLMGSPRAPGPLALPSSPSRPPPSLRSLDKRPHEALSGVCLGLLAIFSTWTFFHLSVCI